MVVRKLLYDSHEPVWFGRWNQVLSDTPNSPDSDTRIPHPAT